MKPMTTTQATLFIGGLGAGAIGTGFLLGRMIGDRLGRGKNSTKDAAASIPSMSCARSTLIPDPVFGVSQRT